MCEDIKHIGLWHGRTKHNDREKVFADKWQEENQLDSCTSPMLSALMNKKDKKETRFRPITQRDAEVAATVIQWLGSVVGQCFLNECEAEITR